MLDLAVIAGLAAGGLTLWRARTRERRIAARHPPLGRFVTVEGRRLHLWQAGTGPDLVMIHGASANLCEFAMGLAPALSHRFRVTLIDRPGLGWSDGGGLDLKEQARLMRLAAEAAGVTRPLVLGHSYGGAVALAWAAQAPVAGLLLLSGVCPSLDRRSGRLVCGDGDAAGAGAGHSAGHRLAADAPDRPGD